MLRAQSTNRTTGIRSLLGEESGSGGLPSRGVVAIPEVNQGCASREAEPSVEVMEVVLDGVLADVELAPDLAVSEA